MKIIFAAFFAVFANIANAQDYDLRTIPAEFSFVSIGNDGVTTVTNLGVENGYYMFEQMTIYTDTTTWRTVLSLNPQSQTVISNSDTGTRFYTPHDCAPSLGECANTVTQDGNTYQQSSSTVLKDGVSITENFGMIDGQWVLRSKSCTIYDKYGFWIDYYAVLDDDTELWGYRDSPDAAQTSRARINLLRSICVPPELLF